MAGISTSENKREVMSWFDDLRISDVLDIGAGQGIWSILLRNSEQTWTALEVFYPYAKMFDMRDKYDNIYIADARYVDYSKIGNYWNLVIAADVLEHMQKQEAKDVIAELLLHTDYLLISVPVQHNHQHAGNEGNDFETHIDHWSADEMNAYLNEFHKTHSITNKLIGDISAYFLVEKL